MTKGDGGMDVMMGDLVLQEDEVNPVMSALLDNGLEVTALRVIDCSGGSVRRSAHAVCNRNDLKRAVLYGSDYGDRGFCCERDSTGHLC